MQFMDRPSSQALAFAVRRLGAARVGLLVARRAPVPTALPLGLEDALPAERIARVTLSSLTVAAVHHVVRNELGVALPRAVLVRIHEASGGNPLLALELARQVAVSSQPFGAEDPLPVGGDLSDVITRRVRELSSAARQLVLVAAATRGRRWTRCWP